MSTMWLVFLLGLLFIGANAQLDCHSCAGAENLPQYAVEALARANISTETEYWGDCSSYVGENSCSGNSFCYKNAVVHKFNIGGLLGYTWTTYTKGCTNTRLDNGNTPSNGCQDINSTIYDSYTETVRQCYCQSDYCNSSSSLFASLLVLFGSFASLF